VQNPFEYGGVVGPDAFCNRKKELAELQRVFENKGRLFLYSERRVGKTSLVKLALQSLPRKEYIAAYVDLWPTNDESDFALRLAKAVGDAAATTSTKLIQLGKTFFSSFKPSVTVDHSGNPQLVFGVNKDALSAPALDDVLEALPKIASQSGKSLVVVLDEFQQIAEYKSDAVEKTLRSHIQHHDKIAYVFLGSKKHVIEKMFLDKQRPLYRSAAHYPLPMIETAAWMPFITEKFAQTEKYMPALVVQKLCDFTQGHPFYTQHLCHALWELTEVGATVDEKTLAQALDLLLKREAFAYTSLWESLAGNQKILITAIAVSTGVFEPFGADFVKGSGLRSASNVQRAAAGLFDKDLIDRDENGSFFIPDKFLKLWLQRRLI
jgi:uncharacterized protein